MVRDIIPWLFGTRTHSRRSDPPGPSWSLIPGGKLDNTPHLQGEYGLFTLVPANKCVVGAKDSQIVSKIWFTSPVRPPKSSLS